MNKYLVKIEFESVELEIEAENEQEAEELALEEAKYPTPSNVEVKAVGLK